MPSSIGVGSYRENDTFSPIASASKNVQRLKDVLEGDQGCGFAVTSLFAPNREELQIAAEDLFKCAEADHLVMLYFCGHAKLSAQHDLYLCAYDAKSSYLDSTTFTLVWLANRTINVTCAAQVLLLFDCVYSRAESATAESATVDVNIASVLQPGSRVGQAEVSAHGFHCAGGRHR